MDLSPQQRDALIVAEQRARTLVHERLVDYALTVWNGLGSWRDADIDRFVEQIAPRVLAGKQSIARLTDVYLSQLTGWGPVGAIEVANLRGLPDDEVYQRPAVEMRTALSNGSTMTDALKAGAVRLASLVATDLQMANVRQARMSLESSGVEAFRRTLTGRENCALCLIASTQRYHRGDLLPIHPGCDCGVASLGKGQHVDQVIDRAALEATHEQVAQFAGVAYRDARGIDYRQLIVTNDHGEIGPVLGWRGQHFTGPGDIAA